MNDHERNVRIAQAVHGDCTWNGQKFHEGEFVALLDGQVVAVENNADDAIEALRALDPDAKRGMVIKVSPPAVDVVRRGR
jgi:hypothetical protein